MTEYIRKQAVLNLIDEFQFNHETNTWGVTKDGVVVLKPDTLDKLHEAVNAMPAADVAPVRHGRWTRIDYHDARCSECGHKTYYPDRISLYCPECGARMDGGADQ